MENAASAVSPPNRRGKSFSPPEDLRLSKYWLHVSQDPINGSDQKAGSFWDKVAEAFENP